MNDSPTPETAESPAPFLGEILRKWRNVMDDYWAANPGLYEIVQQNRLEKEAAKQSTEAASPKKVN